MLLHRAQSPRVASRHLASWIPVTLLALCAVVGCRGTVMVRAEPSVAAIGVPQPPEEVRAAVVRALTARRFALEHEGPGEIAAVHTRRDQLVRVLVEYDGERYAVRLLVTAGYAARPAGPGVWMVDERAARIVRGLRASIETEIDRAVRDRADAAQRELAAQRARQRELEAPPVAAAQPAGRPGVDPGVIAGAAASVLAPVAATAAASAGPQQTYNVQSSQTQGTATITCCINGSLYNCPSQAAFQQCMSLEPHPCTAAGRCN